MTAVCVVGLLHVKVVFTVRWHRSKYFLLAAYSYLCTLSIKPELPQKKSQMDPELGEVTKEEGGAVDVRVAVAEQRRRRRRRRRQRARRAAEEEVEAEFNRRLADKVLETCNSTELDLVFPDDGRRNSLLIIRWARGREVMAPHPSTRAKWRRFFDRYDRSTKFLCF